MVFITKIQNDSFGYDSDDSNYNNDIVGDNDKNKDSENIISDIITTTTTMSRITITIVIIKKTTL